MRIYKIAQTSPFYSWFTNQLLTLTDNYKKPLEQCYSPEVISKIADEFGDLSEEELNKLTFKDLYIISYLRNGVSSTKWLESRNIAERIYGVDESWIYEASKNFPELLSLRVIPPLIEYLEKNPREYRNLPEEITQLLPEELVRPIEKHYLDALLKGQISYPELPEDFKERLSLHSEAYNYVIDGYTKAIMYVDNPHPLFIVRTVPGDIRQDVLDNIAKIKNENAQNIPN